MGLGAKPTRPRKTSKNTKGKSTDKSTTNGETSDDNQTADIEETKVFMELETRRRQNRDAAARHRQRQQIRLAGLGKREAVLSQQVAELQQELERIQKGRCGLSIPEKDPWTTSLLEIIEEVNSLRTSLSQYATQSENLILELQQLAERLIACNTQDTAISKDTEDLDNSHETPDCS